MDGSAARRHVATGEYIALLLSILLGTIMTLRLGNVEGPVRIDEVHRLAETSFFHLILTGDFASEAWFRHRVDRTNPILPKVAFGAAILAADAPLPRSTAVRVELDDDLLGQNFAAGAQPTYTPSLLAMRRLARIMSLLTLACTALLALRLFGTAAGVTAAILYPLQYLTLAYGSTAVADPLLALTFAATPLALLPVSRARGGWMFAACLVAPALLCTAAFATRVTGLLAWGGAAVWLGVLALRSRSLRPVIAVPALLLAVLLLNAAANPYFWSAPQGADPSLNRFRSNDHVLSRIAVRYEQQFEDLRLLADRNGKLHQPLTRPAALRFAAEMLFSDIAGLLLLIGLLLAAFTRWTQAGLDESAFIASTAAVVGVFILWIPFAWPRYFLALLPALTVFSSAGFAKALQLARARLRNA